MNTTPPHTDPAPPRAPWRFVRREHGRMIAGVATGMADAFHIDVVVMRVIWVVATIATGGLGIAAYAICWLAFPSDRHPAPLSEIRRRDHGHNAGLIAGLVLLGIGLSIVFGQTIRPFRHNGSVAWAIVLIGAGVAILVLRHPDDDYTPDGSAPPTPTGVPFAATGMTTGTAATGTGTADTGTESTPAADDTTESAAPLGDPPPTSSAWSQHTQWPTPPAPPSPPGWAHPEWPRPPRRPRRRSFVTPLTISILLIGAGIVVFLDNAGTASITVAGALAVGALITGVALVVSAWFGRARGLIPIGILLLLAAIPATAIDVPIRGGFGHESYRPLTRAELVYPYQLGVGRLDLDLRSVALARRTTYLAVKVGIGEINVDVPDTVRVVVHAHAGAGSVRVFGGDESGWPTNVTRVAPGTEPGGKLDLVARVGAGDVHIRRYSPDGVETLLQGATR